jgi:CRP-like cAMP-binding protein
MGELSDQNANHILRALPRADFSRLLPDLEVVELKSGDILHAVGEPVTHVHFVTKGIVSLFQCMADGHMAEIGSIGIKGGLGIFAVFWGAGRASFDAVVQIPGEAICISCRRLGQEMKRSPALLAVMQQYGYFVAEGLARNAACNRLHSLEQRCARWLLMAQDSAPDYGFPLTQEVLAKVLGVQRTGVSHAARRLQASGLIRYKRGLVAIANRAGLEKVACECYEAGNKRWQSVFPT